jgi:hypothetical protein
MFDEPDMYYVCMSMGVSGIRIDACWLSFLLQGLFAVMFALMDGDDVGKLSSTFSSAFES